MEDESLLLVAGANDNRDYTREPTEVNRLADPVLESTRCRHSPRASVNGAGDLGRPRLVVVSGHTRPFRGLRRHSQYRFASVVLVAKGGSRTGDQDRFEFWVSSFEFSAMVKVKVRVCVYVWLEKPLVAHAKRAKKYDRVVVRMATTCVRRDKFSYMGFIAELWVQFEAG